MLLKTETKSKNDFYASELFQLIYKFSNNINLKDKKDSTLFEIAKTNHNNPQTFKYLIQEKNYFLKGFGFEKTNKKIILYVSNDNKSKSTSFTEYRDFLSNVTDFIGLKKSNLNLVFDYEVIVNVKNYILSIESDFNILDIIYNNSNYGNDNFTILIN